MARIFTNRKSGFIQRSGVMRRETAWISAIFDTTNNAGAGAATLVRSFNAAALALRPFTIVRQHYLLSLQSDQVIATEDQVAGVGTCVVSDQANAIGITAVPTPFTDVGSDLWNLIEFIQSSFLFLDATGVDAQFATSRKLDSKAMRKVEVGQQFIMTQESASSSDGFSLSTVGRLLIKLH